MLRKRTKYQTEYCQTHSDTFIYKQLPKNVDPLIQYHKKVIVFNMQGPLAYQSLAKTSVNIGKH